LIEETVSNFAAVAEENDGMNDVSMFMASD
jgi:hypothetical protein